MAPLTRRQLVQGSAAAAAAASLTSLKTVRRTRGGSPNDELRAMVVGLNGRGGNHISGLQSLPGVDIVALVDIDSQVLARRKAELEKNKGEKEGWAGGEVKGYADLRKALERDDIDIVAIATPNHLHAIQTIWSCQAGKDVYVEKPVCHNVFEGRQMVRAAEKYDRIVATGTQSRSSQGIADGIAWMQAGNLGEIQLAHGTCFKPRQSIGKVSAPTPIPETVDYDLFCGPAPMGPLMRKRLHYDWHWQFMTGNGDLGNQGIHQMDTCRWAVGADKLARGVVSAGGRFGYVDDGDTPNTQVIFLDCDPAPILFEVRGLPHDKAAQSANWGGSMDKNNGWSIGTTVYCEKGYLVIPNSNREAIAYDHDGVEIQRWSAAKSHFANFIEAVRARDTKLLAASILDGHLSSSMCHLGNISYLLGGAAGDTTPAIDRADASKASFERMHEHLAKNEASLDGMHYGPYLEFDPVAERFPENPAANALLTRAYREPFVIKEEV